MFWYFKIFFLPLHFLILPLHFWQRKVYLVWMCLMKIYVKTNVFLSFQDLFVDDDEEDDDDDDEDDDD